MLRQGSIKDIRRGTLSQSMGYLIVGMCYYPRGLRKTLIDEYRSDLAPDRNLFRRWKDFERDVGHEKAFRLAHYEETFQISNGAILFIQQLAERAEQEEIYLICQCSVGERCHREMLMLFAHRHFGAKMAPLYNDYPRFKLASATSAPPLKLRQHQLSKPYRE